jgi:hypothetical protein
VSGAVCTFIGQPGVAGIGLEEAYRLDDLLFLPLDLAFAPGGDVYVVDLNNQRIRHVDAYGFARTLVGTGILGDGEDGHPCWSPCDAAGTSLNRPGDVVVDPVDSDVLWIAAWNNSRIERVSLSEGRLEYWSGSGVGGYADGAREDAVWYRPSAVAPDGNGVLWVVDQGNQVVRTIADDEVTTAVGTHAQPGYLDGPAADALVHFPVDVPAGKVALDGRRLLLADSANQVVRALDLDTGELSTIAGVHASAGIGPYWDPITGEMVTADAGGVSGYDGDGGDALDARFAWPSDVAVGPDGRIYIADRGNHCVRVLETDGTVETFAGTCTVSGFDGDAGARADEALFASPFGVTVGPDGAVYVADTENHVIRRIQP